ncbi:MAG: hypothetical protein RL846_44725 [Deltaproteobacteria bacterium]
MTNVVKASRLSGSIDPKSFFMMVNTNFGVLHRGGTVDLRPLWDALAASHPATSLYGLFLKFAESMEHLGYAVELPPQVEALDDASRASAFQTFSEHGSQADIVFGDSGSFESLDALVDNQVQELNLATGDLKPFIPDETRRQITQYVVYAVKAAPVGKLVDAHQLAYLVDTNFEDLFDGQHFEFNPVLQGMRELGEFKDDDVYVAIIRLEQKLHGMGFELAPVTLNVDPAHAEALLKEAEARERQAAQEAANAVAQTRATSVSQVPEIGEPVKEETSDKQTRKDRSLAKYGIKKNRSKRAQMIRYAVLGVAAVGVLVFGVVTWPNRSVDPNEFSTTIPLAEAKIRANGLYGKLNDTAWWKLSTQERTARIASFTTYVQKRGIDRDLQIRDQQDRVVVSATRDGRIVAAKFFEFGTRDGTIPEEVREKLKQTIPDDAQKVVEKN